MAERPLLALPRPTKLVPQPGRSPRESVPGISAGRQVQRLGPKFDRLREVLPDPARLAELRDDPSARGGAHRAADALHGRLDHLAAGRRIVAAVELTS
jgi:hypothetical protein